MKKIILFIGLIFFSNSICFSYEIDEILDKCVESYSKLEDYTCLFDSRELIIDRYQEQSNIIYKFKKPLNVYMKWTEGLGKGTEVIYSKDKYGDKLVLHPGGVLKFIKVSIDPESKLAMQNNRHSIYESHIGYILDMLQNNYYMAKKNNEGKITFKEETFDNRTVIRFKVILPENKGYYGHTILMYIDKELYLPVKLEVYDWEDRLLEMYHFSQLKVNAGLSEIDFDTRNSEYEY